jgi:hypothetical protein
MRITGKVYIKIRLYCREDGVCIFYALGVITEQGRSFAKQKRYTYLQG